jgi:hypothetical protein
MQTAPQHIALTAILFDFATQVRAENNSHIIDEYADRMKEGDIFPPADVFDEGNGRYWIGDGWHRLLSAQQQRAATFACVVHPGGREAAIKHALGANAQHGLKRSNADKRKAIEVALKEFSLMSDRQLAGLCAVHHDTVAVARSQLAESASSPPSPRLGADGRIRKMPVKRVKAVAPPVVESIPAVATDPASTPQVDAPADDTLPDEAITPVAGAAVAIGVNAEGVQQWMAVKRELDRIRPDAPGLDFVLNKVFNYVQDRRSPKQAISTKSDRCN